MLNTKRILYTLKRKYGTPLDLYRETNEVVDLETGKRTRNRDKYFVKKAILLPSKLRYVLPIGTFNIVDIEIILDAGDLKITPMLTDYIIINHQRYEIVSISQFGHGYQLALKEWKTSVGYEIHDLKVHGSLHLGESL